MAAGATPTDGPIATATVAELAAALQKIVAKGLPATEESGGMLVNLRNVYARAVVPSDVGSRLHALNALLPRLIASLSDDDYREGVQLLFGLAPGTRRTTMTARHRQIADLLSYNVDHVRQRVTREMVEAVAVAVHDDLLRYRSRVKRAAESLEPTGDTPRLGPEHLTHEEELISRIWSRVYALRAELIALARLNESDGFAEQAEDHRQAALREEDALKGLLKEYRDVYGENLIRHGEMEFGLEALERLAGWRI